MHSQLPYWISVAQAFAVPAIALLAVVVGTAQWWTARELAVFNLFDKRFEILSGVRDVLKQVLSSGKGTNAHVAEFRQATFGAEFFFGPEIIQEFDKVFEAVIDVATYGEELADLDARDEHKLYIEGKRAGIIQIEKTYKALPSLLSSYMQMHQRKPFWRWRKT